MSRTRHVTFVDACLSGGALLDDIDDWVDEWHSTGGLRAGQPVSLDEFLGFDSFEGALWAEKPESLRFIVAAHRFGKPVSAILQGRNDFGLAARAETSEKASAVLEWLRQTGRLAAS